MSKHPYTDEQIRMLRLAAPLHWPEPHFEWKLFVERLHEVGVTLTFPEPRYYVKEWVNGRWCVMDREIVRDVGYFSMEGQAERHAREFADRLNQEAVSTDG